MDFWMYFKIKTNLFLNLEIEKNILLKKIIFMKFVLMVTLKLQY